MHAYYNRVDLIRRCIQKVTGYICYVDIRTMYFPYQLRIKIVSWDEMTN